MDARADRGLLPTFLIIGAMKSGTTSLYRYLDSHPQISMSSDKEPEFFTDNWDKGLSWYQALFAGSGEHQARGEASTGYTKHPVKLHAPSRIASLVPDVRLVYLVRHPIERIRSHHRTLFLNGQEDLPLGEAIEQRPDYLAFSSYAMQVEQYLEHFSRDQLLVVLSEELLERRVATLRTVCEHIGVAGEWEASTLQTQFNRTGESRKPRAVKDWVARVPGFELARRYAPLSVKTLGWRALNRRVVVKKATDDDPETDKKIADLLREDMKAFRDIVGNATDRWELP